MRRLENVASRYFRSLASGGRKLRTALGQEAAGASSAGRDRRGGVPLPVENVGGSLPAMLLAFDRPSTDIRIVTPRALALSTREGRAGERS
jgi:hypothetical protein